jgi:hypothetical protein
MFIGLAHLLALLLPDFFIGKFLKKKENVFIILYFIRTVWAHYDRRMFVKRTTTTTTPAAVKA